MLRRGLWVAGLGCLTWGAAFGQESVAVPPAPPAVSNDAPATTGGAPAPAEFVQPEGGSNAPAGEPSAGSGAATTGTLGQSLSAGASGSLGTASPASPSKKKPPVFPPPQVTNQPGPWKPVFYDNDFSFKKDPKHQHVIGEELKEVPFELFGEQWTFSTGGEVRYRYLKEDNRIRPGGPVDTDYSLYRWRHYFDVKAGDFFRLYVEGIDASIAGGEAPAQPIDIDRWDLLNAFVDVALFDIDGQQQYLRVGRQELFYGRQRLISPLDWSNTRRSFEGVKYLHKQGDWKVDAWFVNPVSASTGFKSVAENDHEFNDPNYDVFFTGAYGTYSGIENTLAEFYYLFMNNNEPRPNFADGRRHLVGSHWTTLIPVTDGEGKEDRVWDMDVEGGIQFGEDLGQNVLAGFATGVLGHTWKRATWQPRVSGLIYWGSGDRSPTDSVDNTFYTYFPLGHAYWGISDNLSGQNLLDYSLQLDVKPAKKMTAATAFHWFELASDGDRGYNVAQVPFGAPGNGRNLGQALDVYGTYNFNVNWDAQVGYSWFWYGSFIDRTIPRDDAQQFYFQTSFRY